MNDKRFFNEPPKRLNGFKVYGMSFSRDFQFLVSSISEDSTQMPLEAATSSNNERIRNTERYLKRCLV